MVVSFAHPRSQPPPDLDLVAEFYEQASSATLRSTATKGQPSAGWLLGCSTNKPPQLRFGAQRRRASRRLADFLYNQNGCELRSSKKSTATRSWSGGGCLFYSKPPQLRFGAQRRRASRRLADFLDNQIGCELRSSKKSTATRSWSGGACSTNKPPQLRFGAQRRRASRRLFDFLDNQNGCELRSSKKSTATRSWTRSITSLLSYASEHSDEGPAVGWLTSWTTSIGCELRSSKKSTATRSWSGGGYLFYEQASSATLRSTATKGQP